MCNFAQFLQVITIELQDGENAKNKNISFE